MSQLRPGTRYKGEREVVTTRIPAGMKPRLQQLAHVRGIGMSDLVSEVIEDWIPRAEVEEGIPQQGVLNIELKKTA